MKILPLALSMAVFATSVHAQVTRRVSIDSTGFSPNDNSSGGVVTPDGRYVAYSSYASDIVDNDFNFDSDVFVRDRIAQTNDLVSQSSGGIIGNHASFLPSISGDGRYVAFQSDATNLVAGDTNASADVFVRDRLAGTTERVSVDSLGNQGNDDSFAPSISADGRYVAFHSRASNLVLGDTNADWDVFVHDRQTGTTERVSVDSGGLQGNGLSRYAAITPDGRYVAFESLCSNLVAGDTNGTWDVFVHDRQTGTTVRASVGAGGVQGDGASTDASISGDGRYVGFLSTATDLVLLDTNGAADAFVRDVVGGATERISVDSAGTQANGATFDVKLSSDGNVVTFESTASNLVANDTNGTADIFVHVRQTGATERASVTSTGAESPSGGHMPTISSDGRYVIFYSSSPLVPEDLNGVDYDTYLRDREASGFASFCDPGVAGVAACPCANPPSSSQRGCDNSAATGGARLTAAGAAYLSIDSLVFTTSGEKPTATSVLMQGTTSLAAGTTYGQGIRCVGGSLKRLYTKAASGGSVTVPDFGAGDPSVSARSAAKGDVIPAGGTRTYLVYYRDPVVLGGCPAASTFNTTQSGRVTWWP